MKRILILVSLSFNLISCSYFTRTQELSYELFYLDLDRQVRILSAKEESRGMEPEYYVYIIGFFLKKNFVNYTVTSSRDEKSQFLKFSTFHPPFIFAAIKLNDSKAHQEIFKLVNYLKDSLPSETPASPDSASAKTKIDSLYQKIEDSSIGEISIYYSNLKGKEKEISAKTYFSNNQQFLTWNFTNDAKSNKGSGGKLRVNIELDIKLEVAQNRYGQHSKICKFTGKLDAEDVIKDEEKIDLLIDDDEVAGHFISLLASKIKYVQDYYGGLFQSEHSEDSVEEDDDHIKDDEVGDEDDKDKKKKDEKEDEIDKSEGDKVKEDSCKNEEKENWKEKWFTKWWVISIFVSVGLLIAVIVGLLLRRKIIRSKR